MATTAQQYGMFGPLPFEVEDQQRKAAEAQAMAVAQMNPEQYSRFNSGMAGRGIGQGINTIFGVEDPAVARAKKLQGISKEVQNSGINPANFEEFYTALGDKLAQAGMMKEAMSVSQALQNFRDKKAETDTKRYSAETARMKMEAYRSGKMKSDLVQEVFKNVDKFDPASVQEYYNSITDSTPDGKPELLRSKTNSEWSPEALTTDKKVLFTNKQGQVAVMDENGKPQIYHGPVGSSLKGNKTDIHLGGPTIEMKDNSAKPPDAFNTASANVAAARWEKAAKKFDDNLTVGIENKSKIQEMRKLVDRNNLITGSFSDFKKTALRFAVSLGLGGPEAVLKLSDNDLYDKFIISGVLDLMQKLGGSDSNEELRTLKNAAETREWSPSAIKKALAWSESRINRLEEIQHEYEKGLDEGRRDNFMFNYTTGKWMTKKEIPVAGDEGRREKTTKIKGASPDEIQAVQEASVPPLPSAPSNFNTKSANTGIPSGPKFEAALSNFMRDNPNLTREQATQLLIRAKKGK